MNPTPSERRNPAALIRARSRLGYECRVLLHAVMATSDSFDFAMSKIPTSRAKNAREMGHPQFSSSSVGCRPMGTRGNPALLALQVSIEGVVDGELAGQPFFVRDAHGGEAVCYRAQADALWRNTLLPFDIGSADDQAQPLQRQVRKIEVFENRFEAASRLPDG